MTTSGTYSFSVTNYEIVRQAMLNIGRLDPEEAPTASEMRDCTFMLNMMCKQWQGKADFAPGLKVWTRKRGQLLLSNTTGQYTLNSSASGWTNTLVQTTLAANAALGASAVVVSSTTGLAALMNVAIQLDSGALQYTTITTVVGTTVNLAATLTGTAGLGNTLYAYSTAAQFPLLIETAILRDSENSDTPLKLMTVQDYDYLPNKKDPTNISDPTAILYEPGLNTGTLYTDCGAAQDVSKHIVLTYMETVQDFNYTTDEPYYPQEWYLALVWGLSEQICPMFKSVWSPKQEALKNNALAIARNKGAEISSIFFQPGADD